MAKKLKPTFDKSAQPEWAKLPLDKRPLNKNGTPLLTTEECDAKMKALIYKHCHKSRFQLLVEFGDYAGPSIPLPPMDPKGKMSVHRKRKYH